MTEYLYNAIRATSGQTIGISAKITKEDNTAIEEECSLMIHSDDEMILKVDGEYLGEALWQFEVPAEATKGLTGRYWYCICNKDTNLCFKEPLYLV